MLCKASEARAEARKGVLQAQAAAGLGTGLTPIKRLPNVLTALEMLSMAEGLLGAPPGSFPLRGLAEQPLGPRGWKPKGRSLDSVDLGRLKIISRL